METNSDSNVLPPSAPAPSGLQPAIKSSGKFSMNWPVISALILGIAVIGLIFFFLGYKNGYDKNTKSTVSSASNTNIYTQSSSVANGWKLYRNDIDKFQVEIPSNWQAFEYYNGTENEVDLDVDPQNATLAADTIIYLDDVGNQGVVKDYTSDLSEVSTGGYKIIKINNNDVISKGDGLYDIKTDTTLFELSFTGSSVGSNLSSTDQHILNSFSTL